MTVYDVLIQTMAELTGEPKNAVASFVKELKKCSPNEIVDRELSPEEAEALRATFREGARLGLLRI